MSNSVTKWGPLQTDVFTRSGNIIVPYMIPDILRDREWKHQIP